ncbi:MAG TPA: LysM peptidoglycan-binding domain-containing protein [Polyangiaceae bacterium]|nr:LysM peptidoglycan-binding domain-containing protein [Polyangiaceae bacterium]
MRARRTLSLLALLAAPALAVASAEAAADTSGGHALPASAPDAGRALTEDEVSPPDEPSAPAPVRETPKASAAEEKDDEPSTPSEHVVQHGDTLGGIAHRYGVTLKQLSAANGIGKHSPIRVGERLVIPAPGERVKTPSRVHVVASGNTVGGIAKRYGVSPERLREENHLKPGETLKIGQKLVIPGDIPLGSKALEETAEDKKLGPDVGIQELAIPGTAPAYYYEPTGPGRSGMKPVIIYLHGRGAEPKRYCQRWSRVARHLGWLVCPQGQEDRGGGKRGWQNNWVAGRNIVMHAIEGLRKKYGRRVQLYGNTLVGFSEGAFVAMNVGLREPHTFNRWLILGADTDYWGAAGVATLPEARGRVRRVYLITGRHDDVVGDADEVRKWLKKAGVPVRVSTPADMGHEVALEAKPAMYQAALRWLSEG